MYLGIPVILDIILKPTAGLAGLAPPAWTCYTSAATWTATFTAVDGILCDAEFYNG